MPKGVIYSHPYFLFMLNKLLFILLVGAFGLNSAQAQSGKIVTIKGYAPAYVGKKIEVHEIEDYLTNKLSLSASTVVQKDSTFKLQFFAEETQKVLIKAGKNTGFIYIEPAGEYAIYIPEKDKYAPYRPSGNIIEIAFGELDSTDINYKILGFERWIDEFMARNYYSKKGGGLEFSKQLDDFKTNIEKAYKSDTSTYFKTFVKFTVASLDDVPNAAGRNKYEKHDYYIKYAPVYYKNDAYMNYIISFYDHLTPRLSTDVNQQVYQAVLESSPMKMMQALGGEYTLINLRLREFVMIKALSEVYYSGDFPQTNIITILDSLASKSLFEANSPIAQNTIDRLTDCVPGSKAPDFVLQGEERKMKTLNSFADKHVYLHFFDPSDNKSVNELQLLNSLNQKYGNEIQFVSIYVNKDEYTEKERLALESINWEKHGLDENNSIFKKYRIETFPTYVLIDAFGYVVAAPALSPTPNGQYETIESTFYSIQKVVDESKTIKNEGIH
jgi:hypothetical protein